MSLVVVTTGCATAVDMDAVVRRTNENTKRIEALEKSQAGQQSEAQFETAKKVDSLQKELETLQGKFADSNWTVGQLSEKVENLKAFMEEIQLSMAQLKRKGGEIDRALEGITNRLEADVRTLADKLRQMLESDSGQ